jgi:WD40 repeat protein
VRLWELPGGRELARLDHDGVVRAVAFTGDGRSLVAAADGARSDLLSASVTSWDTASGRRQQQLAVRQSVTGFSLDGRYFATADFKEGTLVRETASGNQVIRISQDVVERFASAVALSPDHHYLAAALNEGLKNYRTYVWELPSRAQRCTFEYGSDVRALAFSSDGRWLAAGGEDNTARVWALDGCRETARISLADEIGAVAFSPDGKFLATGSRDRTARVWALPEATELARLTFGGVVSGVTFSPDGRYVAAASSDRTARVWQWRSDEDLTTEVCARVGRSLTREEWREYLGQEPYRETCAGLTAPRAGTPPANGVAIAGRTPSTRPVPLELESGSHEPTRPSRASAPAAHAPELVVKQDQSSPVNDVAFSPDGTRLAVADWNGVGFWDLTIGCLDARILGRTENESGVRVEAIAFSPDGKLLAGHGSGRGAWLFDLQARTIKRRLETEDEIKSLAFSPDGKLPAAGDDHNAITLWDVASGAQVRQMKEHEGTVTSLAFSPDGKLLVSGGGDDTTRFWDVAGGNQLRRVKGGTNYATVNAVAFSPDGRSVANGALQLLDTTSGTVQDTLDDISGPLDRLVFSPGGELLAGASLSNIPLWDGRTGRLLRKLKAQENLITSIAFSPDGRFLASGAGWQHTVLWDMAKSEPIAKLIAIGAADWLVTSPDGHFDASPGAMTQIRYYKEGQPVALESLTTTLVKRRLLPEILAGTNPRS